MSIWQQETSSRHTNGKMNFLCFKIKNGVNLLLWNTLAFRALIFLLWCLNKTSDSLGILISYITARYRNYDEDGGDGGLTQKAVAFEIHGYKNSAPRADAFIHYWDKIYTRYLTLQAIVTIK